MAKRRFPNRARPRNLAVKTADGQVVSIRVNGVVYAAVEDIPDEADRAAARRLITGEAAAEDEFAAEAHAAEAAGQRGAQLVSLIFGGVALLLLAIGALWAFFTYQAVSRERSAPGQVVDVVERMSSGISADSRTQAVPRPYAYPVVEFYTPDENKHRVELAEGSWPPAYAVGQRVTVLYDPDQPAQARISSPASNFLQWLGPLILGGLGGIFVGVAGLIAWFLRPSAAPAVNS